ncbi:S9 family peptidase [Brevundimonas sp. S30B]|uniref:alpha/beta hydrolase family protein n=1 Tax=unclassified Brevundimonas TaxID=2622653 RepID=UPI001071E113|nr:MULTISPECIES: S9 family peptidase [unclassified Brevundimonas]QBX37195.1 S9 family peptidase [Brevundimonas sp. MF30-B]TFW04010.1 S9 family peptidase [Brevundimonas sp. S30B]
MRRHSLLSGAVAALALITAVPALAQAQPAPAVSGAPAMPTTPAPHPAATPDAFTYQDMIGLNRLADPQVSPDGRRVVYSVTATDVDANRRATTLWIRDIDGDAAPRRLAINEGGANTARWGADGNLYFLSGRSGSSQVWRADASGANPVQVTRLPTDVNAYRLSPRADKVAVSLAVYPDCADLACSVERAKVQGERKSTGQVYERMFVRHWDTWEDHTQNHLFVLPIAASGRAGEAVWVTKGFDGDTPSKPFGDESEFTFAPDGESVVFSARLKGQSEPWSTNFDLWRTNALTGDGTFENLTADNPAWDTGPVFSPDGRTLAYRAMARPGFEADKYAIFLKDVATGQTRQIAANWDRSADTLQWSADGQTLYTTAGDVGQTRLFAIDTRNGVVTPVTGPGHVSAFAQTPSGFVFAQDALDRPSDLWFKTYLGREMPRRLTNVNPSLDAKTFGEAEQFSFPGWNGETVHGYVIKPAGYVEGRQYPVAFLIHGGPQGSFGNSWSYRWNPSTYAGAGYAVVMIDFHGSTGYGQAFTDSISQHWGDRPLEDLQKGWAYAQQQYRFLDGDRACALGASYGGYMVNWIAGNWPGEFKCLVNHDGVFDTLGMGYSTEELWFTEWEYGGTPWENPRGYQQFNPANHVQNWRDPMLVVQGDRDFRIPTAQGLSTFTALQRRGIESRLVFFPDENHWVLRPANSLQWHNEVFGWLNRFIGPDAEQR